MKRFVLVLFVIFLLGAGCADDIIIESPSSLRGSYKGIYEIVWNYGSSTEQKTEFMYVLWSFTDQRFELDNDTTRAIVLDPITYSDMSGSYSLEDVMVFSNVTYDNFGTFKVESVPEGDFNFITIRHEGAPDTLRFLQTGEHQKTIWLVKDEVEE